MNPRRERIVSTASDRYDKITAALQKQNRTELFNILSLYFPRRRNWCDVDGHEYVTEIESHEIYDKTVVDCDYETEGLWCTSKYDMNTPSVTLSHELCVALYQWNCWLDFLPEWTWSPEDYRTFKNIIIRDWELFRLVQRRLAIEVKREAMDFSVFYRKSTWIGYERDAFVEILVNEQGQVSEHIIKKPSFQRYSAYMSDSD